MTKAAREQHGRGDGRVSRRPASWLAWSLAGLSVWLLVARIAWIAVALVGLAITAASTPLLFEKYIPLCFRAATSCLERSQLTQEGLRELEQVGVTLEIYAGLAVGVGVLYKLVLMGVGASRLPATAKEASSRRPPRRVQTLGRKR